jgi:MoaA/NifB/PqqE/SkfB family radical SAM enzyme
MGGSPSRREQLPLQPVLDAIGECQDLGIGALYLTGGEPLMYRGLKKVLEAAVRVPGLKITVCTNGTLLTPFHAALLRSVNAQVNISIDGEREFHDYFRNFSGAFDATERGVRLIVQAGIPLTIVATISQGNLHSLSKLVEWARSAGAVQFRAQPLLKLGRGIDISNQCLTNNQLNRMLLELSDLANISRTKGLRCSVVGVSRRFLQAHPCGAYVCNGEGCHRRISQEIKKLVVREDGTVLPEITNLSHDFALGKIDNGPLSLMVSRYFEDGYARFDQLCRSIYAEVIPKWEAALIPWDQIVAERSHSWQATSESAQAAPACGDCSTLATAACVSNNPVQTKHAF